MIRISGSSGAAAEDASEVVDAAAAAAAAAGRSLVGDVERAMILSDNGPVNEVDGAMRRNRILAE